MRYLSSQNVVHRAIFPNAAAVAALMIIITGCTKPNIGVVTGTVTVDGTPAKSGSIAFFPSDPKASTAGGEIVDGKYRAQVPPGTAKVEIRVSKVVGQKKLYNTANSPVQPLLAEVLPAKYNEQSELTLEVKPGENEMDFPLSTR